MSRLLPHAWPALPLLLLAAAATASGQMSVGPVAVKAQLIRNLDARSLKPGDPFYLKISAEWQHADCLLRTNTTLAGEVVAIDHLPNSNRQARLALRLAPLPCAQDETVTVQPLLIALEAPPPIHNDDLRHLQTARMESVAIQNMFNPNPPAGLPAQIPQLTTTPSFVWNGLGEDTPMLKALVTGEVRNLRNVTLELPSSTPVTTLHARREVDLERDTIFLITFVRIAGQARQLARGPAAPAAAAAPHTLASLVPAKRPAAPVELPEVCAASGCVQALASSSFLPGHPAWTLSATALGVKPRLRKIVLGAGAALDDDAAIHFLGDHQLLLTFHTHALLKRTPQEAISGAQPRSIQAVLLDLSTGKRLRAQSWIVPSDQGPYVWSNSDGNLIAHIEDRLILFGPDLQQLASYPIAQPLLFVSVAPTGALLVATTHEKHTPDEHDRLQTFLGRGVPVPEQYDLFALDPKLHPLGQQRLESEPVEPALLAAATVTPLRLADHRWELEANTSAGEHKVLAHLGSSCELNLKALPANLLFASGCNPNELSRTWYRLLNPAGATLLKGFTEPQNLIENAETNRAGTVLAIATNQFDADTYLHFNLHAADFKQLAVAVYRVTDGAQMLLARPGEGSALRQTFALSPQGDRLAILTSQTLALYDIPASGSPAPAPIKTTASVSPGQGSPTPVH